MRKLLLFPALLILIPVISFSSEGINLSARCAILIDADGGQVLFEKNADQCVSPASLTKLMTALCVLDDVADLSQMCTVSHRASVAEGSSIYLREGERLTVRTLLYGLLLESGNDAAAVLAEYCSGDEETFAAEMNRKAVCIGMTQTHFKNASGLPADGHYSCARDIAVLMRAVSMNKTLVAICGTKRYAAEGHSMRNHNKLLWQIEECLGGKTGYTSEAGRCLVSLCLLYNRKYIAVTLNASDDWKDHEKLYASVKELFRYYTFSVRRCICRLPVAGAEHKVMCAPAENICAWMPDYLAEDAEIHICSPHFLYSDLSPGQRVGSVQICSDGTVFAKDALFLCERIQINEKKTGFWARLFGWLG